MVLDVQGLGLRDWGLGLRDWGLGTRALFRVTCSGGCRFRVSGLRSLMFSGFSI